MNGIDSRPWPLAVLMPDKPAPAPLQDRKRARVISASNPWPQRRSLPQWHHSRSPVEKVRHVLDAVVDNGYEQVDLSQCDLEEIPDDIAELRYLTVLYKDRVKPASLQLYLFDNRLHTLSPTLFQLENLTVLSLRHNYLTMIPPAIVHLSELVELSVGNNCLTFLPGEITQLPKLSLLSVSPNPLLTAPTTETGRADGLRPGRLCHRLPSLFELAARQFFNHTDVTPKWIKDVTLPLPIEQAMTTAPSACACCHRRFHEPTAEEIIWLDVANARTVPLLFRYCSFTCSQRYSPPRPSTSFTHLLTPT
ncbi:outer arm dynein light chain 1 [Hesseltinella vesiculosa]|uniref:Outer arm dynein light chain 1 n=1 Tax=Hesseltinella vesiculosa TaxID=101127 RepID=A0A1X2GHP4_9FUNG|nr:outer arm dynein light chain 1 [Hesseltinella vesiculosa]